MRFGTSTSGSELCLVFHPVFNGEDFRMGVASSTSLRLKLVAHVEGVLPLPANAQVFTLTQPL